MSARRHLRHDARVHAPHRFTALVTLVAATAFALPVASASANATGAPIVGWLNAQRAANGLPAGIMEDPLQSQACLSWVRAAAATPHQQAPSDGSNMRIPDGHGGSFGGVEYSSDAADKQPPGGLIR